ncbi:hypothetical protein CRG98_010798 [Punica granatum]|uniref:KHG/KDPG aldolase n=1 Tax=Punica granatum TaxID=22663 RepID=A0A2I0KJS7_PUNGR|nr:hypothetical protein CRG98_010798 [Punica granatum]
MATVSNSLCSPPCRWRPATALARWSPPRPRTRGCSPPPSLSSAEHTLAQIENSGVIACLRASSPELAMEAACAALRAGISVVGTVLNAKDAQIAISAGARFLMSPAMVKGILADTLASEVLYIPGVMTPTEILSAYDAGAKIVKVYPVSALGGISYISAIQKPFPHIPMVASQGVTIESTGEYIAHGASAVVLSEAIFNKEAMSRCNFDLISQLALKASLLGNEAVKQETDKEKTSKRNCNRVQHCTVIMEEKVYSIINLFAKGGFISYSTETVTLNTALVTDCLRPLNPRESIARDKKGYRRPFYVSRPFKCFSCVVDMFL